MPQVSVCTPDGQYLLLRVDDVLATCADVLYLLTVFFALGLQAKRCNDGGGVLLLSCKAAQAASADLNTTKVQHNVVRLLS